MKRMVLAIIGATRWVICVQMQVSSEKAQKINKNQGRRYPP